MKVPPSRNPLIRLSMPAWLEVSGEDQRKRSKGHKILKKNNISLISRWLKHLLNQRIRGEKKEMTRANHAKLNLKLALYTYTPADADPGVTRNFTWILRLKLARIARQCWKNKFRSSHCLTGDAGGSQFTESSDDRHGATARPGYVLFNYLITIIQSGHVGQPCRLRRVPKRSGASGSRRRRVDWSNGNQEFLSPLDNPHVHAHTQRRKRM